MRTLKAPCILILSGLLAAACGEKQPSTRTPAPAGARILATVNGVPITEGDVRHSAKSGVAAAPMHESSGNVLQTVIRDELVYQKAVELGLDRDEEYRLKVDDLEAQLRAFRRQQLGTLYRSYVQQRATVSDADAREYFDAHASFIRTKFHVLQIFQKGNYPAIARELEDVRSGARFDDVAARRFDVIPAGMRPPWDLGELRWHQVPTPWRGIVDAMQPGQVSDVIKGDNDRFWIVKLADRAVDPAITFETEKERIVEAVRQGKAAALYDSLLADMNAKAKVSYPK